MGGLDFMMLHGSHILDEIVFEKVVDPMDALISRQTKRQNFIISLIIIYRSYVSIDNIFGAVVRSNSPGFL